MESQALPSAVSRLALCRSIPRVDCRLVRGSFGRGRPCLAARAKCVLTRQRVRQGHTCSASRRRRSCFRARRPSCSARPPPMLSKHAPSSGSCFDNRSPSKRTLSTTYYPLCKTELRNWNRTCRRRFRLGVPHTGDSSKGDLLLRQLYQSCHRRDPRTPVGSWEPLRPRVMSGNPPCGPT